MTVEVFILRRAAVLITALVYWAGVLVQSRRIRKRMGRSANLKPRTPKEKILWAGWFVVIFIWAGQPMAQFALSNRLPGLAAGLQGDLSLMSGIGLIVFGYAGTLWCYAAMGYTWRIGIDQNEKNPLVTTGPFRIIRHPIYSFQILMLIGSMLLLPTLLSLTALLVLVVCAKTKAKDEESYLLRVHGDLYSEYLSRTGRFWPKF